MDISKKYIHDRLVLFIISVNLFLTLLTTVWILLRLDTSRSDGYAVQFRSNLGLNPYQIGGFLPFLACILFVIGVLVFHTYISERVYSRRRDVAIVVLGLGTLLISLTLFVCDRLLVLT